MTGQALALFLGGRSHSLEFKKSMEELDKKFPGFAPARFLKNEYQTILSMNPTLVEKTGLILINRRGAKIITEISAVLVPISEERASIMFVDNEARIVYGQLFVSNYDKKESVNRLVNDVMMHIRAVYQKEAENTLRGGGTFPLAEPTLRKIKDMITFEGQKNRS
jgi:hypothetical protein